ncbi:hypothetical protein ACSBR2_035463 [Camellia fascicularis]
MALLDSSSRPHLHRRHKLTEGYMDFSRGTNLLQMVQRHFEEQKIEQLDVAELTQVQHQLDAILRQTRIKKVSFLILLVINPFKFPSFIFKPLPG